MSTLKVNALNNGGSAIDLPNSFTLGGNPIEQGYTSSATEPTSPNIGDLWWDSANDTLYQYLNGEFKALNTVAGSKWFGARGFHIGGNAVNARQTIDYWAIATTGNAADFGDTQAINAYYIASFAADGRAVHDHYNNNTISYFSTATLGNASDFGDGTTSHAFSAGGLSDDTRGIFMIGNNNPDGMEYVTIATTGNATTFGNRTVNFIQVAAASGDTYGLHFGGNSGTDVNTATNVIDYITIQTTGNATDFGDLSAQSSVGSACSDKTRAVVHIGAPSGVGNSNTLEYVTVDTPSNSTDFGDLVVSTNGTGACGDGTYGMVSGGASQNQMCRFTIQTTGNASDFGDLTEIRYYATATSGAAA